MSAGYGNPVCCRCGRSLGDLTMAEYLAWIDDDGDSGQCFDCERENSGIVPELFQWWTVGDIFVIGDVFFEVIDEFPYWQRLALPPHTRARAGARSCLSSSTNLHKPTKIRDGTEQGRPDLKACFFCETGLMALEADGWYCDTCDTYEPVPQEFVLPAWIIGGGGPDFEPKGGGVCADCQQVRRLQHGNGLCAYHHALLTEQYEDGSLG